MLEEQSSFYSDNKDSLEHILQDILLYLKPKLRKRKEKNK